MKDDAITAVPATRPSLLSANLLYLVCILFLLSGGVLLQQTHFGWGLLATELVIGALALLWTGLKRLPWRETLRLRPASAGSLGLAFVMGVGLWLLDTWLGAVASALFGYDLPVPPGMYPRSGPAALLLVVALAVAAPLGEELFFRGYVQRAYERFRPAVAIVLTALLFALFHLSLVGLSPRVPVALALGYVAWRSNSLWPGVLLHAANNASAALFLTVIGLRPASLDVLSGSVWTPGGPLPALVGLLLVVASLWRFHQSTQGEGTEPRPAAPAAAASTRRRRYLAAAPLLLALLIFIGVAALEVVLGLNPALLATEPLTLQPLPWREEVTWSYRLQHPGEETVGSAHCTLEPMAETAVLSCSLQHEPFDVQIGASRWAGGNLTQRFTVHYDRADGALLQINDVHEFGEGGYTVNATEEGEELLLEVTGATAGAGSERIPTAALVNGLWPWQLTTLPFATGGSYEATLVYPQRYDRDLERNVLTVRDGAVVVGGVEPLSTPAGDYLAWRVTVGEDTAWYDVDPPHTLLQYDNGPLIWQYQGTGETR